MAEPTRLLHLVRPIRWSSDVRAQLEQLARDGYPHEVCGLLVGRFDAESIGVERITQARNLATDRLQDRYVLDPDDYLAADRAARKDDLEIVGVWHTHPDHPPTPSTTDWEAAWEGYCYVIVSVRRGEVDGVRAWELDGEGFIQKIIQEV